MSSIKSYQDLLEEKMRLESMLQLHKELIRQDVAALKEDFKPVQHAISTVGKITSPRTDNPLFRMGLGVAGDMLVKGAVLAGGGWLTRLVAPLVIGKITDLFIKRKSAPIKNMIGKLPLKNGHAK